MGYCVRASMKRVPAGPCRGTSSSPRASRRRSSTATRRILSAQSPATPGRAQSRQRDCGSGASALIGVRAQSSRSYRTSVRASVRNVLVAGCGAGIRCAESPSCPGIAQQRERVAARRKRALWSAPGIAAIRLSARSVCSCDVGRQCYAGATMSAASMRRRASTLSVCPLSTRREAWA